MKPTTRILLSIAFLASYAQLNAQDKKDTATYNFTLKQSVDYALQHNTTVLNARLDELAATQKVKEVIGIGLPQIDGSFQVQNFLDIPTSLIPAEIFGGPPGAFIPVQFGTKYNATTAFGASQLVFSGSYILGVKASKVYQDLAQKNTARTNIETTAEVTKAYYTVMVNAERKKLLDANLARIAKLRDDTKALYENGFVEKLDFDRITVTYNNAATEVANVQRLLDLSLVLLKYQMGMDQSANLVILDKIADLQFQPEIELTNKFAYSNRVEYQLLELQLRGRQLQMRAERVGYLPTIAVFGSLQAQAFRQEFDFFARKRWFPITVVGLQVNLPIFDGGQRHYRIQQAKIGIAKAENDLLFIQRTIDMQQTVARVTLQNAAATLAAQKANMELAQSVYDVTKKKYEQGVGSNIEVLNAETSLKEAQTNYFSALYDAVTAKVDYDKSMGNLTIK
ncbi:MAG: TolC family protein [Bacteroidetes bacterium]|jgi:outer membrane protein TolC|nr:TolC family protein [Bacteroidota bacterium]